MGAIAHGFAKKTKQHDRHYNLSQGHGIVEHDDVDWTEMELTPTGKFEIFRTFSKSLEKVRSGIDLILLVVDYQNHGMRLRVNFGIEWGRLLNGKKKVHKGYRPMRRVVQVRILFLWKIPKKL